MAAAAAVDDDGCHGDGMMTMTSSVSVSTAAECSAPQRLVGARRLLILYACAHRLLFTVLSTHSTVVVMATRMTSFPSRVVSLVLVALFVISPGKQTVHCPTNRYNR